MSVGPYTVARVWTRRSPGHHIIDKVGERVPGTHEYGDSKASEARALAELLNAAHARAIVGALEIVKAACVRDCARDDAGIEPTASDYRDLMELVYELRQEIEL